MFTQKNLFPMFDLLKLAQMQQELWWSSLNTIAYRQKGWLTQSPMTLTSVLENQRMVWEKIEAAYEINTQFQKILWQWPESMRDPIRSHTNLLRPLHKRSTANSRRLKGK